MRVTSTSTLNGFVLRYRIVRPSSWRLQVEHRVRDSGGDADRLLAYHIDIEQKTPIILVVSSRVTSIP